MRKLIILMALVVVLMLASGCSGIRTYKNDLGKNLIVDIQTDRGVNLSLHIYSVSPECEGKYVGTVKMRGKKSEVGLPAGKISYLSFNFRRSSFFTGKSSINYTTLIKPKKGKSYKAKAIYEDDMYNVELRRSGSKRELPQFELEDCKKLK